MWLAAVARPSVPEYVYHQMLWTYLPERYRQPGAERPFVYRAARDGLWMLSRYRPACEARAISPAIETGRVYQFDLLCSPARGGRDPETGEKRRRVFYRGNDEWRAWLQRRFDGAAEPLFVQAFDRPARHIKKPGGPRLRIEECLMRGTLRVTDRSAMIERMCQGIGGRGAWGHGLLWLPEVMG